MASESHDGQVVFGEMQALWEDGEYVFYRASCDEFGGDRRTVLVVIPASEHPTAGSLDRLAHQHSLKGHLDAPWAVRPLDVIRERGRTMLVLEDPGAEPLHRLLGSPMELGKFLGLAQRLTAALRGLHERDLIHKDMNPANVLVNDSTSEVWLTGFGIASLLPRERQAPTPPEFIAGTLPYMAPEQTGRMNRSIDSRSDLYSLGITFYQMLTGSLPFMAHDPMEWVHCHIARTPMPPHERLATIPMLVSRLVMKLLAKTAEERYQTAAGVEHDLRHCRAEWEMRAHIDEFPLAEHDVPARLLIPEKLYGRSREVTALLSSFDRVIATGAPEFVLVSGYSGIGKSSVVNELHKALVPRRGLFASGKFDQYKRDIPYATVAQAFQSLVRQILSKNEAELQAWRDALREALGPNGLLIVDLIPELELVIGEQPPVLGLSPQDAQRRFQTVLRRFISVFARPEHPLALFLDDLQWLDAATLDLLEDLLTQRDITHLLLIGAYRDNEVDAGHPLTRKLDAIRRASVAVQDIVLAPLTYDDLEQLISDSLRSAIKPVSPLVQLVQEKTGGNPFFAIQFLSALADEALLIFDHADARWSWDLGRVHAKRYTDNVVDLMVVKLNRLPAETQVPLRQLACVGSSAEVALLATACLTSEEKLHESLWEAVRSGLVHRSDDSYAFQHDRVQEAVYSLIPEEERADAHLRIGRLLLAHTPPGKREEIIFEIVSQFNRSAALITSPDEREQLAQLNLLAGRRAKKTAAHSSALTHFVTGRALLAEGCWTLQYPLTFELEFHRSECEFLSGDLVTAEERLSALSSLTANLVDLAAVTCLRVDLYQVLGRPDRAVAVCLEYLSQVGVEWSPHPTDEDVRREYERIWQRIGNRPIEDLIDLPLMNDAGTRATMDVLTKVMPSTQCTDDKLLCLIITRMVNLSMEFGNSNASCCGYVWFGLILSSYFENYPAARRFGRLSLDLVERRGLDAFKARVYEAFGIFVSPWVEHVRSGRAFLQQAFSEANKIDDLTYAVYCCNNFVTNSLAYGERLSEVEREATEGVEFASKAGFGLIVDIILGQLCLIRMLRGLTRNFNSFDDTDFDERKFEERLQADSNLAIAACWYWIRKLQARVFAQDYPSGLEAAAKAQTLLWTSPAFFEQAEYHFYAALARAGSIDTAEAARSDPQIANMKALAAHHRQIQIWAEHCPENFENRAALVAAELARLEGRDLDAAGLYQQAIRSAHANGFVQNEALACEVAARYYAARGFEDIAEMYLVRARNGYLRWGADGKVRQLETRYPRLAVANPYGGAGALSSSDQQLDVAAVVKASQAVSSEIVLANLIERLMKIAIENAGADRGLLILPSGDEYLVQAEARATGDQIAVTMRQEPITGSVCPESLVRYVIRTRESVILNDASKPNLFAADDYLRDRQSKSILCIPLIKQQQLTGILLLENALASHTFTQARIAVLELLAAQAAISLENTRLYSDLREREAKVRRLVDSNIIGILIGNLDGHVQEANQAFLQLVGYDQADVAAGRLRRTELTPPEWHDRDAQAVAEMRTVGTAQPFEKEYFRKDGSRVPVLVGGATLDERGDTVVIFAVDLTNRKRAEAERTRAQEALSLRDLQLRLLVDSIAAPVALMTPTGEVDVVNSFVLDYFGKTLEELKRWSTIDAVHPDDLPQAIAAWAAAVESGQPYEIESRHRRADGTYRWFQVRGFPLRDTDGRLVRWCVLQTDIDDRKQAEAEARESERRYHEIQMELARVNRMLTVGQLSASIAHEINQPLSGILTNAGTSLRMLTADPPNVNGAVETARRTIRDANRASDITSRLRALFSKKELPPESVDLNEASREVISLLLRELQGNRVGLRSEFAHDLPQVKGDRIQLQQVLLNLIRNGSDAISALDGGSRQLVVRTAKMKHEGVLVSVQDSGSGIDPANFERIFDAFYTTKPDGLGMGLSVCRTIIEAHKGRLWAEAAVPQGSIFKFTLPVVADSA